MALYVSNQTSETTNVSLLLFDSTCTLGGQPWRKEGWWVISPGQTVKPDALAVNLLTVNSWVGMYAFTASGDRNWQGTGNAWFELTSGVHFDQCGEDETNCTNWVDFCGINFAGNPEFVTYISPYASEITGNAPSISVTTGEGTPFGPEFFVSGVGFIPGSTVTIAWEYVYDGNVTENSAAATISVDPGGNFSDIVACNVLIYAGTLSVKAMDSAWGLNASATVSVG